MEVVLKNCEGCKRPLRIVETGRVKKAFCQSPINICSLSLKTFTIKGKNGN